MTPLSFSHLPKLKKVKKDRQPTLFKPDFALLKELRCPKCTRKMKWNLPHTLLISKCGFVLTRQSYDEIISGKRLQMWKEQDLLNKR